MEILGSLRRRITRLRQRLSRRLWERRLGILIALTECQLKSLWKVQAAQREARKWEPEDPNSLLTMDKEYLQERNRLLVPMDLTSDSKELETILEDLQLASMRLTSILRSNSF